VRALVPGTVVDEARGLDHGAWVPALHLWPDADVPLGQLSLPTLAPDALVALGERLAPLRDEGVLVLGSGNVTHNLRAVSMDAPDDVVIASWASDFDAYVKDALARADVDALADFARAPGAALAHPRTEHFAPLLVAAGAAGGSFDVDTFVDGFEYGTLSRRSVALA
jgi:4,5-DOPA dioxygenase extradiol